MSAAALGQSITNMGLVTPYAVSDDGLVACGASAEMPMRWTAGGGSTLLPLLAGHAVGYALSASADGSVLAGYNQIDSSSAPVAAAWHGGVVQNLGALDGGGTYANAVSGDGLVVVGRSGSLPFRWTSSGGMQSLGLLPGWTGAGAGAVSADGAYIAGVANTPSGPRLFRWSGASGLEQLTNLSGNASSTVGISGDGQVIAGLSDGQLYRWTQSGGLQLLGTLQGYQTMTPTGMTGDGAVVIGYASIAAFPNFSNKAVIWSEGAGIVPLEAYLQGQGVELGTWDLTFAFDISADGRAMVGLGMQGNTEFGWHVKLSGTCYANCDNSTTAPVLNVADFSCFLQKFAGGDPYANCDQSTTAPVLNVADFSCFLQKFAAGCP